MLSILVLYETLDFVLNFKTISSESQHELSEPVTSIESNVNFNQLNQLKVFKFPNKIISYENMFRVFQYKTYNIMQVIYILIYDSSQKYFLLCLRLVLRKYTIPINNHYYDKIPK